MVKVAMESKKLALLCRECADNKKAENLVILDVRKISSVTDYYVVCTGSSTPHLRAIADAITEHVASEHGVRPRAEDGSIAGGWTVLDYNDVIVHVMNAETRQRYDLENLWGDALRVSTRRATRKSSSALSELAADTAT